MSVRVAIDKLKWTRPNRGGGTNTFLLTCGHYAEFAVSRGTPKTAWCKQCRKVHGPECEVTKTGGGLVACTCAVPKKGLGNE